MKIIKSNNKHLQKNAFLAFQHQGKYCLYHVAGKFLLFKDCALLSIRFLMQNPLLIF